MLPLNPKETRGQGLSPVLLLLSVAFIYFQPLSANTGGFISKRIGSFSSISQCQNILPCIVHDATSPLWEWLVQGGRSGSGIRAGAESLQGLSVQQTHLGSDPRPPLLVPERRDQERDPKCLCSWGGWRRRGGGAGCVSSSIWERCSSYLHKRGFPSRTQHE